MKHFDYAQRVWTALGCHLLKNYLKLYLASDVCKLANVFENFRSRILNYKLDQSYIVLAPQLT